VAERRFVMLPPDGLGGAPALFATVGTTSAIVVRESLRRKKIVFVNDSDTHIYLARAENAALNAGIRLQSNGGTLIDEPDAFGRMYYGPWSAITSAANKNLCISEDR